MVKREKNCEEKALLLTGDDNCSSSTIKSNYGSEKSCTSDKIVNCNDYYNSFFSSITSTMMPILSKFLLAILFVLLFALILVKSDNNLHHKISSSSSSSDDDYVTASTDCGKYLGLKEDNGFVFKVS